MTFKSKLEEIIFNINPAKINNLSNWAFLASICAYQLVNYSPNLFYFISLEVATKIGASAEIYPLIKTLLSLEL